MKIAILPRIHSPRLLMLTTLLLCFLLHHHTAFAVHKHEEIIHHLYDTVQKMNNQLQFEKSQQYLLQLNQQDNDDNALKFHIQILLSYTYKRVYDYSATLRFLNKAEVLAGENEVLKTIVNTEKSFVYFDTHEYQRADSIMQWLEKNQFEHVSGEDQAKIIMQKGYLAFLNKKYGEAQQIYVQSEALFRQHNPCHLPMVLVKRMQLYAETGQMQQCRELYEKAIANADSCGIIKYNIYAKNEYFTILLDKKMAVDAARIKKEMDSLNAIYQSEKNQAELHFQRESFTLDNINDEIKSIRRTRIILAGIILSLLIIGFFIVRKGKKIVLERNQLAEENLQIRTELTKYLDQANETQSEKDWYQSQVNLLTDRQMEVLELLKKGYANKKIAETLFISENTVKYHIKHIYNTLNIKDRKELLDNQ